MSYVTDRSPQYYIKLKMVLLEKNGVKSITFYLKQKYLTNIFKAGCH